MCRAFRALSRAVAFHQHGLRLNLDSICWPIINARGKAAARKSLLRAVTSVAPSVRTLTLRGRLPANPGVRLDALLQPLSPHVRFLRSESESMCPALLRVLVDAPFSALEEVTVTDCSPWEDLSAAELAELSGQLAAQPALVSKLTRLECCEWPACLLLLLSAAAAGAGLLSTCARSQTARLPPLPPCAGCFGMEQDSDVDFFRHFTALRSLELDGYADLGQPEALAPLLTMPHLSRLTLSGLNAIEPAVPSLLALTQVRACAHRATRGHAASPSLPPPPSPLQ